MALFPAYGSDSKLETVAEDAGWLKNETCPEIVSGGSLDAKGNSQIDAVCSDQTQSLILKESDEDRSCQEEKTPEKNSSSSPTHKKRKKEFKHKKIKKHKSHHSDEFQRRSKYLESIKSVYYKDCGNSVNPKDAYFVSFKKDQSNIGLKATHYSEKTSYPKLHMTLGRSYLKADKCNKRYFSKSNRKYIWGDGTWIPPHEDLELNHFIPLASTSSLDEAKSVEVETNSEAEYWQQKIKKYNEQLSKSPHNVPLWLEFVRVQDQAFSYIYDSTEDRKKIYKNAKLLADRKIAILDSAITKNKRSIDLYLERLYHGQQIWENSELKNQWLEVVSMFPRNIDMWLKYLKFWQTHFSIFDMDEISESFSFCLRKISQLPVTDALKSGQYLVDVSVQLAYAWYQGGYMEKSIALFQALIEFNFFIPSHLRPLELNDKLEVFEAFWDSKAPRFGEENAIGWTEFMKKMAPVQFPEHIMEGTKDEEDDILVKKGDIPNLWIKLECCRELHHWLPWQQDPDDCEDTERMVEFEAIRNHMFILESPDDKNHLLQSFLRFLSDMDVLKTHRSAFDSLRLETLSTFAPDFSRISDTDTFMFPIIGPTITKVESEKYFQFTCQVVRQAMKICDRSILKNLLIYFIELNTSRFKSINQQNASLAAVLAKTSKKEIKEFLKLEVFRADLEVFNAYANFEYIINGPKESLKIHNKALAIGLFSITTFFDDIPLSICLMNHLKMSTMKNLELEMQVKDSNFSREVLAGICSFYLDLKYETSDMPSNASILKVRHKLNQLLEHRDDMIRYHLFFLSVIQLLTAGLNKVSESIEKCVGMVRHNDTIEKIYEDYIWIIEIAPRVNHIRHSLPMKPTVFREFLTKALSVAPANSVFLKKFSENQTWRDILGFNSKSTGEQQSVLTIIYRLLPLIEKTKKLIDQTEMGQYSSGHQIEHLLQSAVKTPEGRSCPLLWRLYLRCCSLVRPKGLKDLVYQAISSCPGVKCIYLDCVQLVPDMLNEVIRIMEEKKMRIRLPLEELQVLLEEEVE